jgi:hypothetical protein
MTRITHLLDFGNGLINIFVWHQIGDSLIKVFALVILADIENIFSQAIDSELFFFKILFFGMNIKFIDSR